MVFKYRSFKLLIILLVSICQANIGYDDGPLVNMTQYPHNSRTLDCWQCYKANGKMCTMRDGKSNLPITGSSNTGHGLCCKHDSTGSECNTGTEVICS